MPALCVLETSPTQPDPKSGTPLLVSSSVSCHCSGHRGLDGEGTAQQRGRIFPNCWVTERKGLTCSTPQSPFLLSTLGSPSGRSGGQRSPRGSSPWLSALSQGEQEKKGNSHSLSLPLCQAHCWPRSTQCLRGSSQSLCSVQMTLGSR